MDRLLMTIEELAKYARVTTDAIYLWRYKEWLPIFSIQPARYERAAIDEWLQKRPKGGYKKRPDLDCYLYCQIDPRCGEERS